MFENRCQCYVERIRLDYAKIKRLVRSVRRATQQQSRLPGGQFSAEGLRARLIRLQRVLEQQLNQHLCGYVEDAISQSPQYGRKAEALRRQQAALVRRVGRIAGEVHQMHCDAESQQLLVGEITDLLDEIEATEKAKTQLLEAALNVDLDLNSSNSLLR